MSHLLLSHTGHLADRPPMAQDAVAWCSIILCCRPEVLWCSSTSYTVRPSRLAHLHSQLAEGADQVRRSKLQSTVMEMTLCPYMV